jgi:hypothetical protein
MARDLLPIQRFDGNFQGGVQQGQVNLGSGGTQTIEGDTFHIGK